MLDAFQDIGTKSTSLAQFGKIIKLKDGKDDLFAPSCCRQSIPLHGSNIIKDTDEFKQIFASFNAANEVYKNTTREIMHKLAKLEMSARVDHLKECVDKKVIKISTN